MNKCAPIKVQFGANINADKTRHYKENRCNYSSEYGNYVELNGSMITQECNLGNVSGWSTILKIVILDIRMETNQKLNLMQAVQM